MDNPNVTKYQPSGTPPSNQSGGGNTKTYLWIGIAAAVIVLILIIVGVIFLAMAAVDVVAKVRDIFIIFMALESLLLGFVLILLVYQIARLTNLLQNEIKPILESTNETVSTLRGTTVFLSDNLVQPVIKINEYVSATQELFTIIGLLRKKHPKA